MSVPAIKTKRKQTPDQILSGYQVWTGQGRGKYAYASLPTVPVYLTLPEENPFSDGDCLVVIVFHTEELLNSSGGVIICFKPALERRS